MESNTANKTDQELVRASLREPNAYAELVARYQAPLHRYVLRLGCRSGDDAQDILQEAFLKAYVNLNSYDQSLKFSSWLYRIVHNEAITAFRRMNTLPIVLETEEQQQLVEQVASDVDLVSETDRAFLAGRVRQALEQVGTKYRDALMLRFLEEKSYDEISDILKVPPGTVATLISRGKKKLRRVLGDRNPLVNA